MKILLDENFPESYKEKLSKLGHDVIHINRIRKGMSDKEVFSLAQKQKRCIVTKDADFSEYMKNSSCYGIIKLNDQSLNEKLLMLILQSFKQNDIKDKCVYFKNNKHCLYVREKIISKKKGNFVRFVERPVSMK